MRTPLEQAEHAGLVRFAPDGKKITYTPLDRTLLYGPEEAVRASFWAELTSTYGYDPKLIGFEIPIPARTASERADLVIFHDKEHKRPFAVIETKADGITDAEFNQAVDQAAGYAAKLQASYVMVVAGLTRRAFDFTGKYGVMEREKNIIADLPVGFGKPRAFRYHRGGQIDIAPVSKDELLRTITKCHNTLWGGGKLSPPTAFSELCKIIFVKVSDENTKRKIGEPYAFQIKTHETSRELGARIRELYDQQKQKDPEVFTETIRIDDPTIRILVSHLESINLSKTDLDVKGVAFERFMDGFFKGDFGQYFTPREITEFAIQMMPPQADDWVLDPACGSGGFLLDALDWVRKDAANYHDEGTPEHFTFWHDFAEKRLFGIEINDELARVAKMNMILHDDGHTNVIGEDSLRRIADLHERNRGFDREKFDICYTNPPFGAQVNVAERPYLLDYDLGYSRDAKGREVARKSQKTEILFLERIWEFLKPKTGRAAIVVPDGLLTNSSLQYVRDFLLERFEILAVISFPQAAFAHFGAGVKSSLLFVRKRGEAETPDDDKEIIFMAAPEKIGFDGTGRKVENQLHEIVRQWKAFQEDERPFLA